MGCMCESSVVCPLEVLVPKPLMVPLSITHTQTLTPARTSGWELPEASISVNI